MNAVKVLLSAFLLCLSGVLPSAHAQSGEVCNETSYVVDIAKAWQTLTGLAVEGWTRILPGTCESGGPGPELEQYLYARSTDAYLGGVREWRGGVIACVDEEDFFIEGVTDCDALELEAMRFRRLTPEERTRAVLIEPADFQSNASEAGLQRLLQAAGYDINQIDGLAGRRTRRAVSQFESDVEREFGTNREALMEALHERALARNTQYGLTICNEAGDSIAVAIAEQTSVRWETRGWWRIDSGQCSRTLAKHLDGNDIYFFARRTGPGVTELDAQNLIDGTEAFCIAPARFLIEERGNCSDRTYEEALFRPVEEIENGAAQVTLDLTDFEELLQ